MRKAFNILKTIFVWLVVLLAVCMMIFTIVSVNTFDHADRNLFGYKAFIVLSDSMSKTDFDAGDLVLVKEVDPSTLQVGDIISYQSTNPDNYGEIVTHKIREITTDAENNPGFITYGTTTDTNDENIVTYSFVIGKYQTSLPGVGKFFQFLKSTPGYIVCIFLPFMILILMQGISSIRLFRQYKKEKVAEMQAVLDKQRQELEEERKRMEAQREEFRKIMADMIRLQQSMLAGNNNASTPPPQEPKDQ